MYIVENVRESDYEQPLASSFSENHSDNLFDVITPEFFEEIVRASSEDPKG